MIFRVTKSFEFQGRRYKPGDIIKMGTRDSKEHSDKLESSQKFTKEIITKSTKSIK